MALSLVVIFLDDHLTRLALTCLDPFVIDERKPWHRLACNVLELSGHWDVGVFRPLVVEGIGSIIAWDCLCRIKFPRTRVALITNVVLLRFCWKAKVCYLSIDLRINMVGRMWDDTGAVRWTYIASGSICGRPAVRNYSWAHFKFKLI